MPLIMREAAKHRRRRRPPHLRPVPERQDEVAWQKRIDEYDLTPVNVAPLTRGKNATDMKLVIEAMDMLARAQPRRHLHRLQRQRLHAVGAAHPRRALAVYGVGEKKAPKPYKEAFDRFFEWARPTHAGRAGAETEGESACQKGGAEGGSRQAGTSAATASAQPRARRRQSRPCPRRKSSRRSIRQEKKDGWARLGDVGKNLRTAITGFTAQKYGHRTMSGLIGTMKKAVETRTGADGSIEVRRR